MIICYDNKESVFDIDYNSKTNVFSIFYKSGKKWIGPYKGYLYTSYKDAIEDVKSLRRDNLLKRKYEIREQYWFRSI